MCLIRELIKDSCDVIKNMFVLAEFSRTDRQQSLQHAAVCLWRVTTPKIILLFSSVMNLEPQTQSKRLFLLKKLTWWRWWCIHAEEKYIEFSVQMRFQTNMKLNYISEAKQLRASISELKLPVNIQIFFPVCWSRCEDLQLIKIWKKVLLNIFHLCPQNVLLLWLFLRSAVTIHHILFES